MASYSPHLELFFAMVDINSSLATSVSLGELGSYLRGQGCAQPPKEI